MLSQKYHNAVAKWPEAWVEGQIVEINMRRSTSGYITLRDNFEEVSLSVMGFSRFVAKARDFRQGDRVVVHGKADVWVKATRLSFVADDIRRVGAGDLKARSTSCANGSRAKGCSTRRTRCRSRNSPHASAWYAPRRRVPRAM